MVDFNGILPGSDPNTPNAFVQTPQQLLYQQQLAQALVQQGTSSAPIQSPWQGVSNLAKALMGGYQMGQVQREQRLATSDATADASNTFNKRGLYNDPSEQVIPATPGQTTPALAQNDKLNDAVTDAADSGQNPRAALAAAIAGSGGGSAPAPAPDRAVLAAAISGASQGGGAPAPNPMALAAALGGGTRYGTSNVGGGAGGALGTFGPAIAKMESGGNYGAVGPTTSSGDRAYGKYQVMGANIPQWTQAALGQSMKPQQFLASPQAQDAVFNHQFGNYVQQYGPQNAASMWLTGRTLANGGAGAADQNGTTGQAYADQFTRNLSGAPASAAISAATAPHVPTWQDVQSDNAAESDAINAATAAGNGALPGATAYAPGTVDRLSPDAAASPLARPAVPPAPTPTQADFGQLRTAMSDQPTPYLGGMSGQPGANPAKSISPSHETAPPSTQPEIGDLGGLLRVASNPWSSPAAQQVASTLLQNQMPQRPSIIEGPTDPNTGYPTKLVWSPTQGVLGRLNADGSISPAGAGAPQQGGGGSPIPPNVDPKKYRETMAEKAAANASPSAASKLDFQAKLAERPSYKELAASLPTANSLPALARENTPAGDTGLIDGIAKILNPGLAVRQGTYAIFTDEQSGLNKFKGEVDKVLHQGAVLQPDTRAQLMRVANEKMQQYKSAWDADSAQATQVAKAYGLNPDRVIPQFPALAPLNLTSISSEKTQAYPTTPTPQTPPLQALGSPRTEIGTPRTRHVLANI